MVIDQRKSGTGPLSCVYGFLQESGHCHPKYTLSSAVVCRTERGQHAVILSAEHWESGESALCHWWKMSSSFSQHSLCVSLPISKQASTYTKSFPVAFHLYLVIIKCAFLLLFKACGIRFRGNIIADSSLLFGSKSTSTYIICGALWKL